MLEIESLTTLAWDLVLLLPFQYLPLQICKCILMYYLYRRNCCLAKGFYPLAWHLHHQPTAEPTCTLSWPFFGEKNLETGSLCHQLAGTKSAAACQRTWKLGPRVHLQSAPSPPLGRMNLDLDIQTCLTTLFGAWFLPCSSIIYF